MLTRPMALLLSITVVALLAAASLLLADRPARSGSGPISLFVEPRDGDAPVLQAIGSARSAIDVEVYLLTDRPVIEALVDAERRGVHVRAILEPHPFGGGEQLARRAYSRLSAGGCQVRWSDPSFTYTHEKAMVIDDREVLIMTCNLSWSAFHRNREYGLVDGDRRDVEAIEQIFAGDWADRPTSVQDEALVVSPLDSRSALASLIASAHHEIQVQDEEIGDPAIMRALGREAASGVDVRIELPKTRHAVAEVLRLRAAGLGQVRLLGHPYLHAKLIIVDGKRAYVGSVNLSATSLDRNREVGRILDGPALVGELEQVFDTDWGAGQAT